MFIGYFRPMKKIKLKREVCKNCKHLGTNGYGIKNFFDKMWDKGGVDCRMVGWKGSRRIKHYTLKFYLMSTECGVPNSCPYKLEHMLL